MKKTLLIFIAFVFLIIFIAISAQAPNYRHIRKVRSDKCLHVGGNLQEDGANIILWDCSDQPDMQQFAITNAGKGYFFLIATHSGKCLQVHNGSEENGGNITQWECNDLAHFKWRFRNAGVGYHIINQNSQKCLHVYSSSEEAGANIVQWDCYDQSQSIAQWEIPF